MRTSCVGMLFALALLCCATVLPSAAQCTPDPGSAIANGQFNGSSCWTLYDPQQLVTTIYWSGNFYAEINGGTDYAAVQLIQLIPVQQGKVYQLSFLTWGVPADSVITLSLQRDTSPWESYGLWQDIPLPSGSNRYVYRFTCTESDAQARFTVFFGRIRGSVDMSSLRLEDITCDQNNLLVNPNFDCDPAYPIGWNWWSNNPSGTFGTETGANFGTYCAKMGGLPGGQFYDAYLDQQFIHWDANRFYLLRFWAKGTDGTNQIIANMKNEATGTQPVWVGYTLTPNWQPYPFLFRPTETTDSAHLKLFTGSLTGDAYFDGNQFIEVPMPDLNAGAKKFYADVTGDGKADLIYCEMRDRWETWVAVSLGDHYTPFQLWSGPCAPLTAMPAVGNFNGMDADSLYRADIAWVDQPSGLAIVRVSDGTAFVDPGTNPWYQGTIPVFRDVRSGHFRSGAVDDIALFTLDAAADAYVLASSGSAFAAPTKWSDNLGATNDLVRAGDFTGDGKCDIALFRRGNSGYVMVAPSTGSAFGGATQWADQFCLHSEPPDVGDIDGDGKCDIATFVHSDTDRRIWIRKSSGHNFPSPSVVAHGYFAGGTDDPAIADLNGDGRADAVAMEANYRVFSAQSWGNNFGDAITWWDMYLPDIPLPDDPDGPNGPSSADSGFARSTFTAWGTPNPVHERATICYTLTHPALVHVGVYDVAGREVEALFTGRADAGTNQLVWDASHRIPGVYFYRVSAGAAATTGKMIVLH